MLTTNSLYWTSFIEKYYSYREQYQNTKLHFDHISYEIALKRMPQALTDD